MEGSAEEVAAVVTKQALAGDMTAARLLLERVIPPVRTTHTTVAFPIDTTSPSKAARSVLQAVSKEKLSPDVGKTLLDGVAAMARVDEVDLLRKELEELKERIGDNDQ